MSMTRNCEVCASPIQDWYSSGERQMRFCGAWCRNKWWNARRPLRARPKRAYTLAAQMRSVPLSGREIQILHGTLLGDGYVGVTQQGKGLLKLTHGTAQESYLRWKMAQLPGLFRLDHPAQRRASMPPWTRGTISACSIVRDELTVARRAFYPDGKKIVPVSVCRTMDSLGLAVWYMDDGCLARKNGRSVVFATNAFDDRDLGRLRSMLRRFGLASSIARVRPGQYHVVLPAVSALRFIEIVRPHVPAPMAYKLP
jgi:LAGLIDADG DNA endonuclease family protein